MLQASNTAVLEAARRDERVSKSSMRLLDVLAEMAENGLHRATQDELAYCLERSIPWVRATALHFEACGYLKIVRRARNREAKYVLKLPAPSELAYRGCSVWTNATLQSEQIPAANEAERTVDQVVDDVRAKLQHMSHQMTENLALLDRLIERGRNAAA